MKFKKNYVNVVIIFITVQNNVYFLKLFYRRYKFKKILICCLSSEYALNFSGKKVTISRPYCWHKNESRSIVFKHIYACLAIVILLNFPTYILLEIGPPPYRKYTKFR